MAEMVVNGVSTRKVTLVTEQLCGKSISKSSVSDLCKDLDKAVKEFKERSLTGEYPFLIVDATYFKVRENHRVISKALMIALAINEKGRREVVGFELYNCENKDNWYDFFMRLQARGLSGLKMITSDAHEGILHGIRRVYPDVPWQRCQFHFTRNIVDKAPKTYQVGLRVELNAMFQSSSIVDARKKRDAILKEYADVAPKAVECLDLGFESTMTVYCFPESVRRLVRTSNYIERLNKELKRRSNAIGVFPNGDSVIRLMGTLLIEYHEKLQAKKSQFYNPVYMEIIAQSDKLRQIAREQEQYLAA
jgi:transposase-like protein